MIELNDVVKRFHEDTVLENIHFHIRPKEVVVVLGPSGSGKSTLLRCIGGLEEINVGTIRIDDITIENKTKKQKEQLKLLRKKTGMVFQNFNLFPHKTALENVIEAPRVVKKLSKTDAIRLGRYYLDKVGLMHKMDEYPSRLSGGQQQRVAIARTLAMEPKVILFDEPTSALDPELIGEVLEVIRKLAQEGITMMIVSHEMEFAKEVADRIIFMSEGHIIEEASDPPSFFARPETERARRFLGQIKKA